MDCWVSRLTPSPCLLTNANRGTRSLTKIQRLTIKWQLLESPGGSTPYIFGLDGYVRLNRLWFSESWDFFRSYNFTTQRFEQGVFVWT